MVHGSVHGTPRCGLLTPSQSSPAGLNHNLLFLSLFFFFFRKKNSFSLSFLSSLNYVFKFW